MVQMIMLDTLYSQNASAHTKEEEIMFLIPSCSSCQDTEGMHRWY